MSKGGSKVKLGLCMEPKFSLQCVQMGHRSSQGYPDSLYYAFNIHRWVKGQTRVAQGYTGSSYNAFNVHRRLKGQTRVMQGVHIMPSMSKGGSKVKLGLHREPKFSLEYPQMGHGSY